MNNSNISIKSLFPIGVYTVKFKEDFSHLFNLLDKEEVGYMENNVKEYGMTSEDTYILDKPIYSKLKNFCLSHCNNYAHNYLGVGASDFKMTQSWISVKPPQTEHVPHVHPNSIISGILYYGDYYKSTPGVTFHNGHNPYEFEKGKNFQIGESANKKLNKYNAKSATLKVDTNTLVLFPSWLAHSVSINNTFRDRKSLAFNTFPKILGRFDTLNELKFDNE